MLTLIDVGGGHRLEPTAARQFRLWNWAHHERFGYDFDVNWSTRDSSQQIGMLTKYYRRTTRRTGLFWDGSYWEKKPGSSTTVAKPGTSPHENGRALDFAWKSATERLWAHNTASVYGFAFNVRGENWHAAQVGGARITSGNQRSLGGSALTHPAPSTDGPTIPQEDTLSAAEVKTITDHITAETDRLISVVQRESRARLYAVNQPGHRLHNKQFYVWHATGLVVPLGSPTQVVSLKDKGYAYIGPDEFGREQKVTADVWANIEKDCEARRVALGGR